MVGRTDCPECGFGAAHVKRSDGEGKRPYRWCPECGAQYFPRTDRQARDLAAKTRGAAPAPGPAPTPDPAPARKPGGFLSDVFA